MEKVVTINDSNQELSTLTANISLQKVEIDKIMEEIKQIGKEKSYCNF
jgi:hypothetical protein